MALTKAQRDALPDSDFAVPGKRALPIHDATHVKMAWDSVSRTKGLTDDERKTAREKILSRAKDLGIDTGTWHITAFAFEAMSLEVPEVEDHPNKMPFSGVLTRVDQESDNPVGGAQGHRTMLTTAVAETALASLLGMAVDYTPALDGHDKTAKIGLITEATIEGDALHIAGFFYAADFPEECALIQAEKAKLGFSYECQARIQSLEADPWLIESCVFTGAAVLYKDKAAYTTTSLAAAAEKGLNMDKEELLAIMAEANKPLLDKVDQLAGKVNEIEAKGLTAGKEQHAVVRPHAEALRSAASAMEAAGIGGHPERGHVKVLRHMADSMEAEAMVGKIPHIYRDHDYLIGASAGKDAAVDTTKVVEEAIKAATAPLQASLDAAKTQITDLSAKAFNAAEGAQRKTITPEIKGLLAKHGLADTAEKGELTLDTVNKVLDAAGTKGQDAYTVKLRLMHSGLLSATTH